MLNGGSGRICACVAFAPDLQSGPLGFSGTDPDPPDNALAGLRQILRWVLKQLRFHKLNADLPWQNLATSGRLRTAGAADVLRCIDKITGMQHTEVHTGPASSTLIYF